MSVKPSALDVYSAIVGSMLSGVHTCMPAEVMRVHEGAHKRQFVDVLPSLQRQARDEDGVLIDEALPIIPMVPVGYMQGGGFYISVPLAVGDIVLVVFAERSLDHWIEVARKKSQRAVIPGDVGTHTLEGAIALPCGPAPRADLLEGVDAADLVIGGPSGIVARLSPDGSVRLAEGAGEDDVALAGKVDAEFGRVKDDIVQLKVALAAAFAALTTDNSAVATAYNTPALTTPTSPTSVAAAKVKAR